MINNFKKFGLIVVLLFLAVGLSGCKKSDNAKVDNSSSNEQFAGEVGVKKEDSEQIKTKKEIEEYCKKNRDEIEKEKKETSQIISNYIKENNISVDKNNIKWATVRYDDLGFEFKLPKNLDEYVVCRKTVSKDGVKDVDFECSFGDIAYLGILKKKQDLSDIDDFLKFLKEGEDINDKPSLDWFTFNKSDYDIYQAKLCNENAFTVYFTKDYVITSLFLDELDLNREAFSKILKSFKKIE